LEIKLHTPENNSKENIRHSRQGESLKSRNINFLDRLEKHINITFHENPPSDSRVPSGGSDGQTDRIKLIVALRNFSNAPKIDIQFHTNKISHLHLNL
jgi:hypothetical protein